MNRPLTLLHTCVYRTLHIASPYFVDGVTYYGGDRLIWAHDIHLLAGSLSDAQWHRFVTLARRQRVARVYLDGIMIAARSLGTDIPVSIVNDLGEVRGESASTCLLDARQFGRSWQDLCAVRGWRRKLAYAGLRMLPSPAFTRGKYPRIAMLPLALLYARRMMDLVRTSPGRIAN